MADITPIVPLTGELAMPEKVWMQGPPGPQGQQGEPGAAATVTVGTVTTGEPGTDAIVTNSGTENAAVLNFTIPKGDTGATGPAGADGVSPTVSTSKSGNVTTITIVDAVGTKTATINDGSKGDAGPAGPAGAGVPDGGTVGQLLGKTKSGTTWIDPPQSGVQPDWNQNDATQPDYVKNRPFYSEIGIVTVENVADAKLDGFPIFAVGDTVTVTVDGVEHSLVAYDDDGFTTIGDTSSSIGNGEGQLGWQFFVAAGKVNFYASEEHTVSYLSSVYHTIDAKYLPKNLATKSEVEVAQRTANAAQTTANAAQTTANAAQTTANAALPKTGGAVSGNLTVDAKNDSYRTVISAGEMALQYVNSADTATDTVVISGRTNPGIVAYEDSSSGFNLSRDGLSLGYTSKNKDGIHLYHSNESSIAGEIVIQHTNLGNYAKERISIASTGSITCNNRLKFDCGSEIEVVQTSGKTGGSAIILRSSTADSTKRFRITVDDSGTISATEVT